MHIFLEIQDPTTKEFIKDWQYISSSTPEGWRIYYKVREKSIYDKEPKSGFDFMSVTLTGWLFHLENDNNPWNSEGTEVDILYYGVAYFDGIRHMWHGDNGIQPGYDNYPNLYEYIDILNALLELEDKYCQDDRFSKRHAKR